MSATDVFVWAVLWHGIADWLLQNEWMAEHKADLGHEAAWIHGAIHAIGLFVLFHPLLVMAVVALHMLIDTRAPLLAWRRFFGQTTAGPMAVHVAIWSDQVLHVLVLALAATIQGGAR